VAAKYILAVLACVFLVAGGLRLTRDCGRQHRQRPTWLMIGAIFGIGSAVAVARGVTEET
jgi:hypothetical protein